MPKRDSNLVLILAVLIFAIALAALFFASRQAPTGNSIVDIFKGLFGTSSSSSNVEPQGITAQVGGNSYLTVSGNNLVYNGQVVVLRGENFDGGTSTTPGEPISLLNVGDADYNQSRVLLGANVIRLGISYEWWASNSTNFFNVIDQQVSSANTYHMWVILNMFVTPGGAGGSYSDSPTLFWNNPTDEQKLTNFWSAVAAHYKDNSTIAGYDIFNEPNPPSQNAYSSWVQSTYANITAVDPNHFVVVESDVPNGINFPSISGRILWSAHCYPQYGACTFGPGQSLPSKWPFWVGEFGDLGSFGAGSAESLMAYFNSNGISWTHYTMHGFGSVPNWGLYWCAHNPCTLGSTGDERPGNFDVPWTSEINIVKSATVGNIYPDYNTEFINGSCDLSSGTCKSGNPSAVTTNSTNYIWTCIGSGTGSNNASCSALMPGKCGNSARNYIIGETFSSTNLCSLGTANSSSVTLGTSDGSSVSWVCTAGSAITCTATRSSVVSGRVAYYKFDGNANDEIAGRNGNLVNGPGFVSGKNNQAINFSSASSQMVTTNAIPSTSTYTISLWAYINTLLPVSGSQWATIVAANNNNALQLYTGKMDYSVGTDYTSNTILPINRWVHLAMTNNNGAVIFYLNGVADGTVSTSANAMNVQYIGGDNLATEYFNGMIDDLQIYNRTLSAAEILSLNNSGSSPVLIYQSVDTNHDWIITGSEINNYTISVKGHLAWPSYPSPPTNDLSYYNNAVYLLKHGAGAYHNNVSAICPPVSPSACWISGA